MIERNRQTLTPEQARIKVRDTANHTPKPKGTVIAKKNSKKPLTKKP